MSEALPLHRSFAPSEPTPQRTPVPARAADASPPGAVRRIAPTPPAASPAAAQPIPRTTAERMLVARDRLRAAAIEGRRIRSYEVALDLDLSEFHFARQFRLAFGRSPHVFYDEVRAERARELLREGCSEGEAARRIGMRRPAELRALLEKRPPAA